MSTSLPKSVSIIEVGPRDGLQNEKQPIALADKLQFIELLTAAGIPEIEAGSFVSPKWVPQMADSEAVFEHLRSSKTNTTYSALVPNEQGMSAAIRCGVKKIAVFTAASESFNRKNINCGIDESITRFLPVLKLAQANGMSVRGYVSTAFVCPYEGAIQPSAVTAIVDRLIDLGINDISIGDTIGRATPVTVAGLLEALLRKHSQSLFAMHFHDTYGTALANVSESLRFGITHYDSSSAGLGGCPYAPGASGNVATDDLVWFLESMGIATGIDSAKLRAAGLFIQSRLNHPLPSRMLKIPS
jgi:hydroxymethylglutaryl-CoA lyase